MDVSQIDMVASEDLPRRKLLILGAYRSEIEIVNAARQMGYATVVTDNHLNWDEAPAKYVADEAWDISWSDVDSLAVKCEECGIGGVLAGFSEKRVVCASMLSARLGLPFYAHGAQLDTIVDKDSFKQACIDAGIDVARSFDKANVEFPVIVKPADNGGSKGISICFNDADLAEACEKALTNSVAGRLVIEEYIRADEVMIYYTVEGGEISFSAMCDRYMHLFDARITQLPVGYVFPSKHQDAFLRCHDAAFRRLIQSLGIQNGLIAFQTFIDGDRAIPFDPTFRLDGTMAYHVTERMTGENVLRKLVAHSMTGSMTGQVAASVLTAVDAGARFAFELPILLGQGVLAKVVGLDELDKIPEVVFSYQKCFVGDKMEKAADFQQILVRVQLAGDDLAALLLAAQSILDGVVVENEEGDDMVIYRSLSEIAAGAL